MVSIMSLWLPILVSAAAVFIVSSFIHMFLPYHQKDFGKVPKEDEVMKGLRDAEIPPGDYAIPCPGRLKEMRSPGYIEKMTKGPVAFMTVTKSGPPSMGGSLLMWFLYSVLVGIFAAYVTGRLLGPGTGYLTVFRFTGAVAFCGYSLALLQNSIWYKRKWWTTIKSMFDGLIYALVTAGIFGWLWPS